MASAEGFIKSNPTDFSDWENSVSLYGDSCTWGYDIPDEQRLHNIIETDRIVNNFGYPGESNVHMLMRFLDHIEKYGYPHMVVMGWSSPYRMAKFANQQVEPLGGWERNFQEVADNNKIVSRNPNLLMRMLITNGAAENPNDTKIPLIPVTNPRFVSNHFAKTLRLTIAIIP